MPIFESNMIIVAAPSGGGKTSLIKKVISTVPDVEVSISHTTRAQKSGEQDGKDYFFVSEETFLDMVAQNEFIEHAHVFGHYYGTSIQQVKSRLEQKVDILLDIDWQGAEQIKVRFPNATSIFIVPPSLEELEKRLVQRGRDCSKTIDYRMRKAKDELRHYAHFDYIIVNEDFDTAASELSTIILSQRLRTDKQIIRHQKLLSFLLEDA